jgi:hypothetical protein
VRISTTTCLLLVSALLLLGPTPADAQSFTLTPTCAAPCGRDYLGPVWTKPSGAIYDAHEISVRMDAATLLRSTSQHIAISGMASGRPFLASGSFSTDASNGGIGIALGRIDNVSHAKCPQDTATDDHVELGIEQFNWRNISSQITACTRFSKSLLSANPKLLLNLEIRCMLGDCTASASLRNDATGALLASVTGKALVANPTATRNIWYAVTKFATEAVQPSVSFQVLGQTYISY